MKITKYIAVPSENLNEARGRSANIINFSYRIGRGFHLYRTELPENYRGGILGIDRIFVSGNFSASVAAGEILRECKFRNYHGVFFDIDNKYEMVYKALFNILIPQTQKRGITVYIPENLAHLSNDAVVVISTALSGGKLSERLSTAIAAYGIERIALDVELLRMDFAIPALDGKGTPITDMQLKRHLSQGRTTFYSSELCANYFSYMEKGIAHFVVFDTAATILQKLQMAEKMGISTAFFLYPEIKNIYNDIMN